MVSVVACYVTAEHGKERNTHTSFVTNADLTSVKKKIKEKNLAEAAKRQKKDRQAGCPLHPSGLAFCGEQRHMHATLPGYTHGKLVV